MKASENSQIASVRVVLSSCAVTVEALLTLLHCCDVETGLVVVFSVPHSFIFHLSSFQYYLDISCWPSLSSQACASYNKRRKERKEMKEYAPRSPG